MRYRFRPIVLFCAMSLFCFGVVPARLIQLQILHGRDYREMVLDRKIRQDVTEAPRGRILDRNGTVLAKQSPAYDLTVSPRRIKDREKLQAALAQALNLPLTQFQAAYRDFERTVIDKKLASVGKIAARRRVRGYTFLLLEHVQVPPGMVPQVQKALPRGTALKRPGPRGWFRPTPPEDQFQLWIDYAKCTQDKAILKADLPRILGLPGEELEVALHAARQELEARVLKRARSQTFQDNLPLETMLRIAVIEPDFPELQIRVRTVRRFPEGPLLGQILGSVGRIQHAQLQELMQSAEDPMMRRWARTGIRPSPASRHYALLHEELARIGLKLEDTIGQSGTEAVFEEFLRGRRGQRIVERDSHNRVQDILGEVSSNSGDDVVLSIDSRLQRIVEQEFDRAAGAAVFMDVHNGEILAAASFPGFDPNDLVPPVKKETADRLFRPPSPLFNRILAARYPLGSIFKVLTSVSMLEEGFIRESTRINCRGALFPSNPYAFRCWLRWGHGPITVHEAIQRSCNVFFYSCADRAGPEPILKWAREFEFGARPGSELRRYESRGLLPTPDWKRRNRHQPWYKGDTRNLAIGQGMLLVNPIQVARMMAAIANGGTLPPVRFVKEVHDEGGKLVDYQQQVPLRAARRLPISARTLSLVRRSLIDVVHTPHGTASRAFRGTSLSYRIAGKTSTAQKSGKNNNVGWFAGFAPADKPKIAFVVVVEGLRGPNDEGHKEEHGGDVAAPIVRRSLERFARLKLKRLARLSSSPRAPTP